MEIIVFTTVLVLLIVGFNWIRSAVMVRRVKRLTRQEWEIPRSERLRTYKTSAEYRDYCCGKLHLDGLGQVPVCEVVYGCRGKVIGHSLVDDERACEKHIVL